MIKELQKEQGFYIKFPWPKETKKINSCQNTIYFSFVVDVNWQNRSVKENFNDAYRKFNNLYCVLSISGFCHFLFAKNNKNEIMC